MHYMGFFLHLLMGVFDLVNFHGQNGYGLNGSWAEKLMGQNDPEPRDLGAGP